MNKNHLPNEVKKAYSFSRILNPKSRRMKYIFSDIGNNLFLNI